MNSLELVEKAKTALGVKSNYALSKKLLISEQRLSEYCNGKRTPDNYAIAKFAKVLEVDPWTLLKEIEAQTEKNPERRDFWKKQAMWAGAILTAVIFNMSPSPANAATTAQVLDNSVYYVKSAMRQLLKLKAFLLRLKMTLPESLLRFFVPRIYQATT